MNPAVSVVIPTHNRRQELERALNSVAAQSFQDFEIVVVDDGSTDGTADWLRSNWPSATLVENSQPAGAAAARNLGLTRARGGIVAFLDDDDTWAPSFLAKQVEQFRVHPETDLCSTGHIEVNPSGQTSSPDLRRLDDYPNPLMYFLAECPIHTLSVVACRRAVFERIGLFEETLSIVHDLEWYLRLLAAGGTIRHIPDVLVRHSVPGGLVTRHRDWFEEERSVQRRYFTTGQLTSDEQRKVHASRAILFARISAGRGDPTFALARLAEALTTAPWETMRLAVLRLSRRVRFAAPEIAEVERMEVP